MAPQGQQEFIFVDQSGADTHQVLQQSRKRIRQHARQHTISSWKTNRLQAIEIQLVNGPDTIKDSGKSKAVKRPRSGGSHIENRTTNQGRAHRTKQVPEGCSPHLLEITPNLSVQGYEQTRSKYNFDITWLSALALNHVGRAQTDDNTSMPSLYRTTVHDWLNFREPSYLDLIPSYYDSSPLVRILVDALLVKIEDVLYPRTIPKTKVLGMYGKALKSVQDALKDAETMETPETLCATQIIQLYELLYLGEPEVWIAHTQGLQKLIQARGPKRFSSDLDRRLLCAQLQHTFNQAFMENRDCFLEQPDWQDLLRSIASENNPACHPMQVNLWAMMVFIPRLMRQTGEYLLEPESNLDRRLLVSQLRNLKRRVAQWRMAFLNSSCHMTLGPAMWRNLYGVNVGNETLVNRLILAINPSCNDSVALEMETQVLGAKALTLKTGKIVTTGFYVGMITKATKDEWMAVAEGEPGKIDRARDVVSASIFVRWNAMMGRGGGKYGSFWPESVDRGG